MNDSARVIRRPAGIAAVRAAAIIATVGLLAAACSGSGSSAAYSACMRSHGVPNFPDPTSSGTLPKADPRRLGVSNSQLRATRQACQHVLPIHGGAIDAGSIQQCFMADDCPRALVQQVLTEERRFAQCMRAHGVPNWPDPIAD